jgi:hypothetical protein
MREVASCLGIHVGTVWRWYLTGVRGRKLATILIGGRRFVREIDLEAFLSGDNPTLVSDRDLHARAKVAGKLLDAQGVRADRTARKGKPNE